MVAHPRVSATARAGDDVHVDVLGQGFRMVLHAGTAPEITEDHRGHAHRTQRSQQEPTISRGEASSSDVPRRVLITVGATAGHVYPALAIADAYRAAFPDVDVRFAGAADPLAVRLLGARGHTLQPVSSSPFVSVGLAGKLAGGVRVGVGLAQARRLLRSCGTRLVVGLGGHASTSILLAARTVGARVALHEANVAPGVANRLLAPFAHRVYLGFAAAVPAFAARDPVVTGHPVRPEIAALAGERRAGPARDRAARVLVLSSTRGERFLADRVPALLGAIARHGVAVEALHQSGQVAPEELAQAYRHAGVRATVMPYLDQIAAAYRWADLVIARSGAGTIAEIAAAGLPAVLVPLADAARDHQAANAAVVAAAGAAIAVPEAEWQCEPLAARTASLLGPAWAAAAQAARWLAQPDAAARIVADCEASMTGHW
jgi:UDP-N-acetylglucosamine--N-acetylmuramyl-(pentapeptide) pyrophosphoryl-undecaprenol N-acetylglucosamine transferase